MCVHVYVYVVYVYVCVVVIITLVVDVVMCMGIMYTDQINLNTKSNIHTSISTIHRQTHIHAHTCIQIECGTTHPDGHLGDCQTELPYISITAEAWRGFYELGPVFALRLPVTLTLTL